MNEEESRIRDREFSIKLHVVPCLLDESCLDEQGSVVYVVYGLRYFRIERDQKILIQADVGRPSKI